MDNKVPFRKNQESRSLFSKQTPARDRLSSSHQHPAKSPSSSCTQTSGSGSQCPTGARQHATTINTSNGGYVLMLEPIGMLDKA
uniref:Uncharacterized protein n=1 Tax=Cucumis melo TaxID=3656 RepID=A0A9I9D4R8_CUCME